MCNVLNLAVGDFAMLGGLGTAVLIQVHGVPLGWAILIDLFGVGLIAYIFDRLVLHFAFDRGRSEHGIVSVFFYTFGLSLAIEGGALLLFGSDLRAAPQLWNGQALHILDFNIERAAVLVIALAIVSGTLLWLYLRFTVSGRAASACGESLIGARIAGIDSAKFLPLDLHHDRRARRALRGARVTDNRIHRPDRTSTISLLGAIRN